MLWSEIIHYLILNFPELPLWWLVIKADPTPVKFTHILSQLDYASWVSLFYKVSSPIPWIFYFPGFSAAFYWNNLKGSDTFWRVPYYNFISEIFGGVSKVAWGTEWSFPRTLIWRTPAFCLRINVSIQAILGSHFGSLAPFWKGIRSSLRDSFAMTSCVLGNLLSTYSSCRALTKKVLRGNLPFYLTGFI